MGDATFVVAITIIFGGGTLFLLAVSPIGRAIAARIKGSAGISEQQIKELQERISDLEENMQATLDDNITTRDELVELQERLDFAERLLAERGERKSLSG